MTHTPKCAESTGEFQIGIFGAFLIVVWFGLHNLCHEAAHLLRGVILHLRGGRRAVSYVESNRHLLRCAYDAIGREGDAAVFK